MFLYLLNCHSTMISARASSTESVMNTAENALSVECVICDSRVLPVKSSPARVTRISTSAEEGVGGNERSPDGMIEGMGGGGSDVGSAVGASVGSVEGKIVGSLVGRVVGRTLGDGEVDSCDGDAVGANNG